MSHAEFPLFEGLPKDDVPEVPGWIRDEKKTDEVQKSEVKTVSTIVPAPVETGEKEYEPPDYDDANPRAGLYKRIHTR